MKFTVPELVEGLIFDAPKYFRNHEESANDLV